MLRTEQFVRFQPRHERDFQIVDFEKSAHFYWAEWLKDPRNDKFKALYDSTPVSAQEKLKAHVFQPFKLMKEIAQDHEKWDLVRFPNTRAR